MSKNPLPADEESEFVEVVVAGEDDEPGTRTIRVYDKRDGDFTVVIPMSASITFGYFNPAAPREQFQPGYDRGPSVAKQTALRIYADKSQKHQLACFLGVAGFRDTSLTITRLKQRVTIETNYENDGDQENFARRAQRALMPQIEDDGEEVPF